MKSYNNSTVQVNESEEPNEEMGIDKIFLLLDDYAKLEQEKHDEEISLASGLSAYIEESEYKPSYQLNIFDEHYGGLRETETSKFLKRILDYRFKGEAILVKSFVKRFLVPLGFDFSLIKDPKIKCEDENVDIIIREDSKYAIVIENKLKGAVFQMNQLARYVELQKIKGYSDDQIFVVILPNSEASYKEHLKISTWRLPPDWQNPSYNRECCFVDNTRCLCDFNKKPIANCTLCKKDLKEEFSKHTKVITTELSDSLETDCFNVIPGNERILKSAVIQFADYLNELYNNRISDELKMDINKYLTNKLLKEGNKSIKNYNIILDKLNELSQLQTGLNNLRNAFACKVVKEWYVSLYEKWNQLLNYDHTPNSSNFFIKMKEEIYCGCYLDKDFKPYWSFWTKSSSINEEQRKMVLEIIKRAELKVDLEEYKEEGSNIAWAYTQQGDKDCDAFFTAAKELDLLV